MPTASVRPWPITLGGYLLSAHGAVLLGMGLALIETALTVAAADWAPAVLPAAAGGIGLSLGLATIANALRVWRRRPGAWLTAMLLQGINLGLALFLYWRHQRSLSYPLMLAGVLLVVYLHRGDVVEPLREHHPGRLPPPEPEAADE